MAASQNGFRRADRAKRIGPILGRDGTVMAGDPGLPIKLHPCSNGEFVPRRASPLVREAVRRARADAEANARRLGMSRRRFLLSSMGAATTLLALGACSDDASRDGAADFELVPDGVYFGAGFPQSNCGEADERDCFSIAHWAEEIFGRSDTALAVISAIPVVGEADPLSIEAMERGRRVAAELCGDERVLIQGHAVPNVGPIEAALDAMEAMAAEHSIAAWKVYTHSPGPGWAFTDATGEAFLAKVTELAAAGTGPRIVSVHKGFGNGSRAASPADIGPAAVVHPDIDFVVYHSGFESAVTEGAYSDGGGGVDRLIRSLRDAGVGPGGNVYAELGSTWRAVMGSPDEAAHVLGKLLAAVGPDNVNVIWGTDSIWYGSPQDQIQAFRTFAITPEYRERFGYPELTDDVKARVMGANAAAIYGVDLDALRARCAFTPEELDAARQESALGNVTYGPVTPAAVAATFAREHPWTVNPGTR
jgi:predicted TIM-barrel fold metal-dependent hydrolase